MKRAALNINAFFIFILVIVLAFAIINVKSGVSAVAIIIPFIFGIGYLALNFKMLLTQKSNNTNVIMGVINILLGLLFCAPFMVFVMTRNTPHLAVYFFMFVPATPFIFNSIAFLKQPNQ